VTTKEVLIRARKLIEDPKRWTQHASARTGDGEDVLAENPQACQFCLYGALAAVAGYGHEERAFAAMWDSLGTHPIDWNDEPGRSHAEVLAAFDHAIETAA
jgi:hypothetical protein